MDREDRAALAWLGVVAGLTVSGAAVLGIAIRIFLVLSGLG